MLKVFLAGFLSWALVGASAAAEPGSAKPVPAAEARAVRAVVQAQLDALAADDAVRAFSFASPSIRQQFGDARTFMNMVRQAYPMIVRPAAVGFFVPLSEDGAIVQVVQLRDRAGAAWRAVYELRQQPDKTWRVNGCSVVPDNGAATT
ncbi:MAG: DUF4864 domain-containing protein [Chitinophagaceae bacterium]|nr:DUF4864 domain-containing protein [Rubrivivax sp.]